MEPQSVQLALPSPSAFVYGSLSAKRRADGWWYVAAFIADHTVRENEGTWVFLWPEQGGVGRPLAPRPLISGAGTLELGAGGVVLLWGVHRGAQRVGEPAVLTVGHVANTDRPGG
jgi:hypothetical protein